MSRTADGGGDSRDATGYNGNGDGGDARERRRDWVGERERERASALTPSYGGGSSGAPAEDFRVGLLRNWPG